jgi:RNA polymerase sigma factor (TIGR02999 family)
MDSVTTLLDDWVRGDPAALERLVPIVYPDLRVQARSFLRRGARPVTLQTTAVVNDMFVKLLTNPPKRIESRRHFFALAARLMRMALVDHYRERSSEKRGGRARRVPLHEDLAWVDAASDQMLSFDRAMRELEQLDREQADLFGMRFVLGCTAEETAELAGLSKATVDRRVKLARAWLFARLREADSDTAPNQ